LVECELHEKKCALHDLRGERFAVAGASVRFSEKKRIRYENKNAAKVFLIALQEMQQTMGILNPKQSLPELSEVFTKLFGGASSQVRANKKANKVNKQVKKRS